MKLLQDLPNELCREIFSYLGCEALARVSRLSRRLKAAAEPSLYRTLSPSRAQLPILLRAILSRPMLANYATSVSIDWIHSRRTTAQVPPINSILRTAADSFRLDFPMNSDGGQLILLLCLLPRLARLTLVSYSSGLFDDFLDQHAFQPATTLPIGLQSVREINWISRHPEFGVRPHSLLTMLLLPSIRTINVTAVDKWNNIDLEKLNQFERTSTMTDLGIGRGNIPTKTLERILKIVMVLQRFSYGHHQPCSTLTFNAPAVGRVLGMHRETLQYLVLCFTRDKDCYWGEVEAIDGVIGSLREWPALVKLKCSLSVLLVKAQRNVGVRMADVLPVVIQEFEICDDYFWREAEIADEVEHLLRVREAYGMHSLRMLRIPEDMADLSDRLKAPWARLGA